MTRFLSESLGAPEPSFRLGLRDLERANGAPNADIILSTEVMQGSRQKLFELGLDSRDTTGRELYLALQARLKADDIRLIKNLRTRAATYVSADGDVVSGMAHALRETAMNTTCFAIKHARLKTLIKKTPPKKVMKQLGYRSLDSMLKHEPTTLILGAALLVESAAWQRSLFDQYKHLRASDFETRKLAIMCPTTSRWQSLAQSVVSFNKHNLLTIKELGAIILLPLPDGAPEGSVTASMVLALQALNDVYSASTFLKLCQVRPDFGALVRTVAVNQPTLHTTLLDQPVPWHLIQRSFKRLNAFMQEDMLGPHMLAEDFSWESVEKKLEKIEPALAFWKNSAHLAIIADRQPVSFNIVDTALNLCNQLPYEHRIVHYFQQSLWHELLLRYLQPQAALQAILQELQPQQATERITGN
jgi:hypothetical protein